MPRQTSLKTGLQRSHRREILRQSKYVTWRNPGEVRFDDVKVHPQQIGVSQCKFLETALRFHPLDQFTLIQVDR
jgi:hypothetical protein